MKKNNIKTLCVAMATAITFSSITPAFSVNAAKNGEDKAKFEKTYKKVKQNGTYNYNITGLKKTYKVKWTIEDDDKNVITNGVSLENQGKKINSNGTSSSNTLSVKDVSSLDTGLNADTKYYVVARVYAKNTKTNKYEFSYKLRDRIYFFSDDNTSKPEVSNEIKIRFHYLREDNNYKGWNVYTWTNSDSASYDFDTSNIDEKGSVCTFTVPTGTNSLGFIIRLNDWEAKDFDGDRFIDLSSVISGSIDIYANSGQEKFDKVLGDDAIEGANISSARLDDTLQNIDFVLSAEFKDDPKSAISVIDSENNTIAIDDISINGLNGTIKLKEKVSGTGKYFILLNSIKFNVNNPDIFSSKSFEDEFTYTGNDLGATWSKEKTNFRIWAPTATNVKINLYKSGDASKNDLIETIDMKSDVNGTWITEKTGDLNGTYYTYTTTVNGSENEACDPYAKTTGVNGDRAMIIDLNSTNPSNWDKDKRPNTDLSITDAIIYELHVRDLSSDKSSGIKNSGKYLGLTEKGTKNSKGISTGLDHMLDLGITHLHLNPVYDYATVDETKLNEAQFNWGYDPKNYNVPDGSYSTDPYNGAVRVNEFKQMVQTLHENNISVIMDVVYNHTYNAKDFCFDKLVPDYFYRIKEDGHYSNGSGCGNDVASERSMVSKYIVDSIVYWAKEYHIDGFRFDLVGLIDTDTINAIRTELNKIDPSIILYGEGWTMETSTTKNIDLATQPNVSKLKGFAMFNDVIRDNLKGSVFDAVDKGYVNGNLDKTDVVKNDVMGITSWSTSPTQLINYTSCHDNLTLWDKINSSNADDSLEDRVKQNLLAASIVYTSQGTPFILAGEEMLRSKPNADGTFNHNSYNASDAVNSIKWDNLNDETYQKVYNYYKGLIQFRKAHSALRMTENTKDYIHFSDNVDKGVIAYSIDKVNGETSNGIFVIYNPLKTETKVKLPDGNWNVYIKDDKAGITSLETVSKEVTVSPISCMVLAK